MIQAGKRVVVIIKFPRTARDEKMLIKIKKKND